MIIFVVDFIGLKPSSIILKVNRNKIMSETNEIKLYIAGLVYNQSVVGTYGLVLAEEQGKRRFSVMIGEPEAQSIAMKLNNKKPPRPLTHDLIFNILKSLNASLVKVLISDMLNDIFYSELHIKVDDRIIIVDARTSDAVALAVRSYCPLYIKSNIIDIVGTEVDTTTPEPAKPNSDEFNPEELTPEELETLPKEDLNELLEIAVQEEKYELAVKIRDALKKKDI